MNDPRDKARELIRDREVTLERLWVRYWAEGGNASESEFDAYLYGALTLPAFNLRLLTWAMADLCTAEK